MVDDILAFSTRPGWLLASAAVVRESPPITSAQFRVVARDRALPAAAAPAAPTTAPVNLISSLAEE
jgi:hypothetical protein